MKKFENKTVMVTGGGKNIGKEIALDFAKEGANVIVCDYDESNAKQTVMEIEAMGVSAMPAVCDVRDRDKIFEYVGEAIKKFGGIDVLVNNAGVQYQQDNLEDIINSDRYQNLLKSFRDRKPCEELCKSCTFKERFK